MFWLERDSPYDNDFSTFREAAAGKGLAGSLETLGHGYLHSLFVSTLGVIGHSDYSPSTHAGRLFAGVKSFCFFILMSAYLANLVRGGHGGRTRDSPRRRRTRAANGRVT